MDFRKIKRAFRLQLPPEHPYDAGPGVGSRMYEAVPNTFPVVTYSLLLISVVLFFLTDIQPEKPLTRVDANLIKEGLGFRGNLDIILGDWWALLSSTVFHGSSLHLMMNGMAMFSIGAIFEKGLGTFKTLGLFSLFAIVSAGFQVLVSCLYLLDIPTVVFWRTFLVSNHDPFSGSLGLSGVLFAIIGFMWGSWKRWTGFLSIFNLRLLKFVFFWQVLCFVLTFTNLQNIANTAHISGFVFGFFMGMWMCYGINYAKLWFALSFATLVVLVAGLAHYYFHFNEILEPIMDKLKERGFVLPKLF